MDSEEQPKLWQSLWRRSTTPEVIAASANIWGSRWAQCWVVQGAVMMVHTTRLLRGELLLEADFSFIPPIPDRHQCKWKGRQDLHGYGPRLASNRWPGGEGPLLLLLIPSATQASWKRCFGFIATGVIYKIIKARVGNQPGGTSMHRNSCTAVKMAKFSPSTAPWII